MNPILSYHLGLITFDRLQVLLWDFGPNAIDEIGERCFAFYCSKANGLHNFDYYILKYGCGLNAKSEWYCE
jgi:hypothetical protein